MTSKKYTSYDEIDRELEILRLEKEINYQKLILTVQKTKENFTLQNLVSGFLGSYKTLFSSSYGTILNIAIPYIIKWIVNKKRGN